jgi:inorganic triphosphatase YgiF
MLEIELKFAAHGPEPLQRLANVERLAGLPLGAPETADELDRYLDTADGALARERWACRVRTRGGRTIISLKGPREGAIVDGDRQAVALHRRPELEGPADAERPPAAWPGSAARERLLELSAGAPLEERLGLAQQRTERHLLLGGAQDAQRSGGVLSLDAVTVLHRGARLGRFWSVELEAHDPSLDLDALGAALAAVEGLRPDPLSKLEHALALLPARAGR